MTFACETWAITKSIQDQIYIWERKTFRKRFGWGKMQEIWEKRTNQELSELYNETKLSRIVKAQRVRWMGHIIRTKKRRMIKYILNTRSICNRGREKFRVSWKRQVEVNLEELGIREWRRGA